MTITRRDAMKTGALGAVFAFLFRGRSGALQPEPITPNQLPSAATITCTPQGAFRAERLVISGVVVGRHMVAVRDWIECPRCEDRGTEHCEACDDAGGTMIETGEQREENVMHVPWIIENIEIRGRSQFTSDESLPGDLFSAQSLDPAVSFDSAEPGSEIRFRVRYTGDKPGGERFIAALIGTTRDKNGLIGRAVLPIHSSVEIQR
jgi:hypothetical protein